MASYQYVYVMKDLTKAFPGGREVFRGITLAFLPGVKIGVLGVNGAGKSTLMKIMAGIDTDYGGEAWAAEGARVGYLEQEPQLDPDKTVGENVEQAFADAEGGARPVQRNLHEIRRADERRGDEHAAVGTGRPAGEDRRRGGLGPRPARGHRAGCAALPAGGRRHHHAVRRRAAARGAVPAAAGEARPAAAGRTDQPPRRRKRRLAGAHAARLRRHRDDRHARPLLPGQRHRLDPGDRARPRLSVRGQLLVLAGAEAQAPGAGGEGGKRPPACAGGRAGVDRRLAARAPGEEPRAHPALRGDAGALAGAGRRRGGDRHPAGTAPGQRGDRGGRTAQGLRQQPADRRPELPAAARRHRRRDRPERRRQDDAVPHDHRPGAAGCRRAAHRRDGEAGLRRSVARQPEREQQRVAGDQRRRGHDLSRQARRDTRAPMSARSTSRGRTSRRRSASCRAASATGCTWRRC